MSVCINLYNVWFKGIFVKNIWNKNWIKGYGRTSYFKQIFCHNPYLCDVDSIPPPITNPPTVKSPISGTIGTVNLNLIELFNLFVTSKIETTNSPFHQFKVLLKGQVAFHNSFLIVYYLLFTTLKNILSFALSF